ncbi:MAG: flagellar hook-basal body complex protein, partial [Desulfobacteraceae bacterium]
MSLTSSLYTGTSGLTNMGNSMQVIGDNISNVNTVGFKGNRSLFADLLNQSIATQSGSSQVGRGTAIQIVDTSFQQGSFESTGNTTDLSIGGNGFFQVRDKNSQQIYYTRAGNFTFDKDGKLINPDGFVVQGWELDEETGDDIGAIKDIVLDSFTSPPKKTDTVNMVTNLDADSQSQSIVLANAWDATEDDFIAPNNYEYQSVVKVYDSLGSTHDITIYYDKKAGSTWEYLITCNPDEDSRNLVQGTSAKGLLARGEIKFNESDGSVGDMTMERFTGIIGNVRS